MKKQLKAISLLMAFVMVIGVVFSVACFADNEAAATITPDTSWYLEKSKTKTVTLRDAADLAGFSQLCNESTQYFYGWTIKLGKDIVYNEGNAADFATTAPANVWKPIEDFWGTFDGQGYVISGLYFKDPTAKNVGLFGCINGATVKNVSVVNSYFSCARVVGSIAGEVMDLKATVSNCYSDAIIYANPDAIDGAMAGGIVGQIIGSPDGTLVENCWFAGSILAETSKSDSQNASKCGGIVGWSHIGSGSTTVKNCLVTGSVTAQTQASGIVGAARDGADSKAGNGTVLENCLMLGTVGVTRISPTLFFGQFSCVWKNGGRITLNNVYGLDTFLANVSNLEFTGDKTTKVWNVGGTGVIVSDNSAKVSSESITGDAANTTLVGFDFEGEDAIWETVAESTPVIKSLSFIAANKASGLAEAPIDPTELEVEVEGGSGSGNNNESKNDEKIHAETDKATSDTVAESETEATLQEEKSGCGSSVACMSAVVLVCAGAAVISKKKKEN